MEISEFVSVSGYEKVRQCFDEKTGLRSIIAVHNTALGNALGGTRLWPYENELQALKDVLRLSEGMTRKAAMANLNAGGGKGVIIASQDQKTKGLLEAYAEFVNSFEGLFSTGEDVGISAEDVKTMRKKTSHIFGLHDPSPFTASGVFHGIKRCAKHVYGSDNLEGRVIAIQGLGHVGSNLASLLWMEKADLIVTDIDKGPVENAMDGLNATAVAPSKIFSVECDIFVPCALGSILNSETIPQLKCRIVAGAANNQLAEEKHGYELLKKGILHAPDYIINAGGLIYVYMEKEEDPIRWMDIQRKIRKIADTLEEVITASEKSNEPPQVTADRLADREIRRAINAQDRSLWI